MCVFVCVRVHVAAGYVQRKSEVALQLFGHVACFLDMHTKYLPQLK